MIVLYRQKSLWQIFRKYTGLLLLTASLSLQAEVQVYKVERVVSPRSDSYGDDSHGLGAPVAQFEIGAVMQGDTYLPLYNRNEFENVFLIGSAGVAVKTGFVEFEKNCEYLCGDELEECHYSGLVSWVEKDIGVPLLAVTGLSGQVTDFKSYIETAATSANELLIKEQELIWPIHNFLGITVEAGESRFFFHYENDYSYEYEQAGNQCSVYEYEGTDLSRLSCNGAEALLEGQVPLLYSNADYNLPNAQLVNGFTINGQQYYTVMLALKAYTSYGLLTKEGGKWRFIVKPADWAQLC